MKPNLLFLAGACLLSGCTTAPEACDDGPCWLELQSWVTVSEGNVDGLLRWVYGSTDPAADASSTPDCETWEHLALAPVAVDDACRGCTQQYEGTATIDADDSTCADADWEPWTFTYAFGPIGDSEEMGPWAELGYTHQVQTRWSPDLGDTQGFQTLFVATPEAWDGGPSGSRTGEPSGQYAMDSLHFWDLR